ncbi:hypothetical protein GCM10009801_57710 [Streptomyces albiaxialis]|uniref:Uncharacterized protein n=1 Tax=Streptomyces albiaxialis TaxID=329523 RepID=A0ABP5I190_9ACTN
MSGCPLPLHVVSSTFCGHDEAVRASEVRWLTTLNQPARNALIGGTFRSFPDHPPGRGEPTPLPDLATADPVFRTQRTRYERGQQVADTMPDRILRDSGLVDVAREAADRHRQHAALAPTTGYAPTTCGGPQRTDRIYVTPGLRDAVRSVEVVDTVHEDDDAAATRTVSPHALLLVRLDRAQMEHALTPGHRAVPTATRSPS